ncbi:MAG: Mrp/NBP35 family ATP-binding protein [Lentisphaeria bacterium]|nr:Mrp/NBP35 family ATP-binding protein [Lentisphaeria bacterium]
MSSCSGNCGSCASAGGCNEQKENQLKGVREAILVLSGKGGVGKSTVAASVAVGLAKAGKKVGLLDVDFHGPSQPTLFGLRHIRLEEGAKGFVPADAAGVKLISVGLVLDNPDHAVIWRGPAKTGALKQLLEETDWGELDYLVMDFPPGTGDESLAGCQLLPVPKRALVVTTPQEVALADCRKCIDFCAKLEVPVIGIVENMSGFVCPGCGSRHELFGTGGGARLAEKAGAPLLAQIPLDPAFLKRCDYGELPAGLEGAPAVRAEVEKVVGAITAK